MQGNGIKSSFVTFIFHFSLFTFHFFLYLCTRIQQ